MVTDKQAAAVGLMETCLGQAGALLRACGARPSKGQSKARWPYGGSPEMARKAVFSEGRGLCVREYGPDASRGMA